MKYTFCNMQTRTRPKQFWKDDFCSKSLCQMGTLVQCQTTVLLQDATMSKTPSLPWCVTFTMTTYFSSTSYKIAFKLQIHRNIIIIIEDKEFWEYLHFPLDQINVVALKPEVLKLNERADQFFPLLLVPGGKVSIPACLCFLQTIKKKKISKTLVLLRRTMHCYTKRLYCILHLKSSTGELELNYL